uniref:Uncharacterized protein n=1 Tax=Peromyscus maniculatus bairdii TaxID=230844 RepID=A0A8C9CRZ8_PERMB
VAHTTTRNLRLDCLDWHVAFLLQECLSVEETYNEKELLQEKLDPLSDASRAMAVHENLYISGSHPVSRDLIGSQMTLSQKSPKTIRKHRYLHYNSKQ